MNPATTLAPLHARLLASGCTEEQARRLETVIPPLNPTVLLAIVAKYGVGVISDLVSLWNPSTGPDVPDAIPPVVKP